MLNKSKQMLKNLTLILRERKYVKANFTLMNLHDFLH